MEKYQTTLDLGLEDESPSPQQDCHANPSLVPGSSWVQKTTVSSGLRCAEYLEKYSPVGLLSRTLLTSSEWWNSTKCFLIWKEKATKSGHSYFLLQASTPRTCGTGCGLSDTSVLPTPTLNGNYNYKGASPTSGDGLQTAIREMLPTPQAFDATDLERSEEARARAKEKGGCANLRETIQLLPTPCLPNNGGMNGKRKMQAALASLIPTPKAQNANSPGEHGRGGKDLQTFLSLAPTPTARDYKDTGNMENVEENHLLGRTPGKKHGLRLQPAFALWMMGYPEDWCDFPEASEEAIESCREAKKEKRLSRRRTGEQTP